MLTHVVLVCCIAISFKVDVLGLRVAPRLGAQVGSSGGIRERHGLKRKVTLEFGSSSTALHFFFDADTVSNVASSASNAAQSDPNTATVVANTFVASVTTRLTGILIGNILAGAFVKYVTDFFKNGILEKEKEKEKERGNDSKDNKSKSGQTLRTRDQDQSGDKGLPSDAYVKLVLCLAIDLLGDTSFLLPGIGELEDIAWAPMSAYALRVMFGSNVIAGLDFAKELLPGTDIVPVATLAWFLTYVAPPNFLSNVLDINKEDTVEKQGEGSTREATDKKGFIDV